MTEKEKKNVSQNCTSVTVLIKLNISINSHPIDLEFCMVPNLTKLKGKGKGEESCHSTLLYLRVLCNQICSSGQQRRAIKHPLSKNGSTQQHGPGTCLIYYEQSNFNKKKENK